MLIQPFAELALLLLIASIMGVLAVRLRQPPIIAYIASGILVGPALLGLVHAHDQIDLFAQIGITVLLFLVGLKLDLQHIRHIGPVALLAGSAQLVITIALGFGLLLMLSKDWVSSIYLAIALSFSSTIIIVKFLSDNHEIDSLHGRIAIGILIVQDLAVILVMMASTALGSHTEVASFYEWLVAILSLISRAGLAALFLFALIWYVIPFFMRFVVKSQEILLVFAIAWGTSFAAIGEWIGFSKEAGAFMAGFSLASTHFRDAIYARLTGIRDFLLLFFFINLGAKLEFTLIGEAWWLVLLIALFVLIVKPIILIGILGYMGYRKRTSFQSGLTMAQLSEFSIIFISMGISLGHLQAETLELTILVAVSTIALSAYMILNAQRLFENFTHLLSIFERKYPYREISVEQQRAVANDPKIIIFGLGRYGARILKHLHQHRVSVMGVDFDPEAIRELRRQEMPVRYGDAENPAFLDLLPLRKVDWIVTTIPEWGANQALLHALNESGFSGRVVGLARDDEHAQAMLEAGVTRVVNIFHEAADLATDYLAREIEAQEKKLE